jgi:hypothetical protein
MFFAIIKQLDALLERVQLVIERGVKMASLISWLLEEGDPGVRYLALRDLKEIAASPQKLAEARHLAHIKGKTPALPRLHLVQTQPERRLGS